MSVVVLKVEALIKPYADMSTLITFIRIQR